MSSRNVTRIALAIGALMGACAVQAQGTSPDDAAMSARTLPPAASVAAPGEIDQVSVGIARSQSAAALLRARLEEEKVRSELDLLIKTREQSGASAAGVTYSSDGTPSGGGVVDEVPAPHLVAVYGTGKNLMASVRYGSGLTLDIAPGQTIEGGFKVTRISAGGVTLTRGGKRHDLNTFVAGHSGSSTAPAATAPAAAAGAVPGRPGAPGFPSPPGGFR